MIRWWRHRTLHTRLSLLVTGAVTIAVLLFAALAFAAVAEIQRRQMQSQLNSAAAAVAAAPDLWRTTTEYRLPGAYGEDDRRPHDLGPRWQVLAADGRVVSGSTSPVPVTPAAEEVAGGRADRVQERITIDGNSYLMLTVRANGGGAVQIAMSLESANRTLGYLGGLLLIGAALGIGGAALLGRTVARAGLVPVQQLSQSVERVAVTMDLTEPVPVRGADEIARLGRSVNSMLAALDNSRRAQRALIEDASHELRTPLTSIRTNIELLLAVESRPELAHRLPPEERGKLLRDLEAQVSELATLTTELVELAREESARERIEPVDLAAVVHAAADRVRTRAPGVAIVTDLAPVTVDGRPGELERMVVNVLDNAAKWSPPAGSVHTRLMVGEDDRCTLTVADDGPGIDEADRPYVFDRFYRALGARGMPGSGLGLAIVAQTVAQHGGTVSTGPNSPRGTVITITLPVLD